MTEGLRHDGRYHEAWQDDFWNCTRKIMMTRDGGRQCRGGGRLEFWRDEEMGAAVVVVMANDGSSTRRQPSKKKGCNVTAVGPSPYFLLL